jgi:hypothetical protein
VFPSSRHQDKAVCAVEVVAQGGAAAGAKARHVYTFCVERVAQGSLKNCWLTVGVRVGDYANV